MHAVHERPQYFLSLNARIEAGYLLRQLQKEITLSMPQSRPLPDIGVGCHELRVNDEQDTWRIVYRIYKDAILILEVFSKKSNTIPKSIIKACKERFRRYEADIKLK
jgi:phage-related protein